MLRKHKLNGYKEKIIKPYVKKHKPEGILTDNSHFKEEWDNWCKENGIEPLHAHPYYPQDKGKVERAIRNFKTVSGDLESLLYKTITFKYNIHITRLKSS